MKKISVVPLIGLFLLAFAGSLLSDGSYWTSPISKDVMRVLPGTQDYRNYFFLQSIDDTTSILIGDFTGKSEKIIEIIDKNSDNTIDMVYEYDLRSKKLNVMRDSSTSKFFNPNIAQMKRDIISGDIFSRNYSYQMKSIETLHYVLDSNINIYHTERGYLAKFLDPDSATSSMAEFYFRKENGRYDLQFRTNYYKIFRLEIHPVPPYSVYCRNSKDPVVAETVESLLKEVLK